MTADKQGAGADARPAPKVSFVSLGCPKALVDSERIITRLRAEGYELTRTHEGAALAANTTVVVTACMGPDPEQITARFPNVLAIPGPQQYESVLDAVHLAA